MFRPVMRNPVVNSVWALVVLLALLLGLPRETMAQRNSQLRRQLRLTEKFIKEAKKNQEMSFSEFELLREQVKLRQKLLRRLNGQINENQAEIDQLDALICTMEEDIEQLKVNYKNTAKETYLYFDQNNFWLSLLSSGSLSEAYYRLMYYQQFSKHRSQQIALLQRSQRYLMQKSLQLSEKNKARRVLVTERTEEINTLKKEEERKKVMQNDLQSRYAEYKAKKKRDKQIVKKAIDKNDSGWEAVYSSTKAENSTFLEQKGLLDWPVKKSRCIVVGRFGKTEDAYGNPITNDGIFIRTQAEEPVRSIFSGTVTAVQNLPLGGKMVIVAHGNYRATYSNVDEVIVRKGEQLTHGQRIGIIRTDTRTGESVLQFLIYKLPGTFVNPELWLGEYSRGE